MMIRSSCVILENRDKARLSRTGGTARLNGLGYCHITRCIKAMMIRGGENIHPAEIEHHLGTHAEVQEVQLVEVKDEWLDRQVCACIRLREDLTSSAEEVRVSDVMTETAQHSQNQRQ